MTIAKAWDCLSPLYVKRYPLSPVNMKNKSNEKTTFTEYFFKKKNMGVNMHIDVVAI